MSVPAVQHSPPPVSEVSQSNKRQRLPDRLEVEEKERASPAEPAPISFDPSGICADIFVMLQDRANPRTAAEHVMQFSPDILLNLAVIKKDELLRAVQQHFLFSEYPKNQEKQIEAAVLILY